MMMMMIIKFDNNQININAHNTVYNAQCTHYNFHIQIEIILFCVCVNGPLIMIIKINFWLETSVFFGVIQKLIWC